MREIDLHTAVQEIVASTAKKRLKGEYAFFFIVGAGISYPQIPLASGIEAKCQEKLTAEGSSADIPLQEKSSLDRYESLFDKAYPQAEDRQEFLHNLIHKSPISAANFRLAHLLGEFQFTNLVLTPNFDEMLSRALRLLGYDVVVCDHPKTIERVRHLREDLQVVHVHGTHWFYDSCNIRAEIESRAVQDLVDGLSMGQLLDRVLADRPPIVIGYSGWEGDVIMAAIKRRLRQGTLPRNLYWFCFTRSHVAALPPWLKDHTSVRLVLPPPPLRLVDNNNRKLEGSLPSERIIEEGLEPEESLPARVIFEAFIRRLNLRAPHLTSEPLEFFSKYLTQNLSSEEEDEAQDAYLILQALERMQEGARLEREAREQSDAESIANKLLAQVIDAIRRSDYDRAIETATQEIDFPALTIDQRFRLSQALEMVYWGTSDPEHEIAACELRLKIAEIVKHTTGRTKAKTTDWDHRTIEISRQLASALVYRGFALRQTGRTSEAVIAYEEVERRFGEATEPPLREWVAKALVEKGVALGQDGSISDEIAIYDEVERRFGNAAELVLRERVAKALVNKGFALRQDGQQEEAISVYKEVERRFKGATETLLRQWVAKANYELSAIFLSQGRLQEALIIAQRGVNLGGDHYNLALALARNNELDKAFTELEYCLSTGEISREHVLQDPDWEHLRNHPKFRELTKAPPSSA